MHEYYCSLYTIAAGFFIIASVLYRKNDLVKEGLIFISGALWVISGLCISPRLKNYLNPISAIKK